MITLSANGLLGMEVESMFCEEICPIISHSAETKAEAGLLMALEEYKVQCGLTNMLCSIAFFFFFFDCLIPILFISLTRGLLDARYPHTPRYQAQNEQQRNLSILTEQSCVTA